MAEKTMFIVWNNDRKGEAVMFDNYDDAYQTSTGNFSQMSTAIGERFFELYEDYAPLPIETITI